MPRSLAALAACLLVALVTLASTPPNLDRALEVQRNLALERPGDAEVLNDLGNLLILDRRLDEAEQAYRRALELDEGKLSARFNLALLLQSRSEHRAALHELDDLLERAPDHAWGHYQRGVSLLERGSKGKAEKAFAEAFRLDPTLADPKVNPQVIRNPVLEESMLRAYRERYPGPPAPRSYDDPTRIAGLLVPEMKEEPPPPEVLAEAPEGAESKNLELETVHRAEPVGPPETEGAAGETPTRVLTVESLEDQPSGGRSEGAAGSRGTAGTRGSTNPRGGQRVGGRTATPRGGGDVAVPSIRLPDPPSQPSSPGTTIPRGRGRTNPRSTGQLEIDLVPVRAG